MALFPLQGHFRGDFVPILLPVDDADTIEVVGQKLAHHVINRRIPAKDKKLCVQFNDNILDNSVTVANSGMPPMAYIEVFYEE